MTSTFSPSTIVVFAHNVFHIGTRNDENKRYDDNAGNNRRRESVIIDFFVLFAQTLS